MRYVKWVIIVTFWVFVAAFLHYTLPQKDIVRITDIDTQLITVGENSIFWAPGDAGSDTGASSRDVFFIRTVQANGSVMVYRNEDTSWGWPPYFKFDTSNLQTEASDLRSTSDNPRWVLMTHYGWRFEYLSIFPNAIALRPIESPEVGKPIPWLNIVILTLLTALFWAIRVRWVRFRRKRLDPRLEDMRDSWEAAEDAVSERGGRLRRWLRGNG